MRTEISTDPNRAVELLRKGEIVALPTETVYGLAANALDPIAVAKIFEAKQRPSFDPLIVHLPEFDWFERVANIPTQDRQLVFALVEKFWPGPFTIVLPKHEIIPDIVTAGLATVAVRISAHPIFREIVREFGSPLAAPSANRFGRISPTSAEHVAEELSIPLVIDGGPTQHGLESTIVALKSGKIDILRRGPITDEQLRGIGFQPMNPFEKIFIRDGAQLPHWRQTGATYAVTFRLVDSLPPSVLENWQRERRDIILTARQGAREFSEGERAGLARLFSEKVESYLDAGSGSCWLRDQRIAMLVRDALRHFDGHRYRLLAWCIMPNHVHVIVRPEAGYSLSDILHTWKSFTASKANQLLNREGSFWQAESYDHLIRDEQDLRNQIRYLTQNPTKAGLESWPWVSGLSAEQDISPTEHRQDADATIIAPGQLPSHYAPDKPLKLVESADEVPGEGVGLLAWNLATRKNFAAVRQLSEKQDLREAAANLFRYLRELDANEDVDLIVAERVPDHGLGAAIMDRLRRAAHPSADRPAPPR